MMALTVVGCVTSESFVERVGSVAKQILTDGRTNLSEDIFEQLTLLRVNRKLFTDVFPKISNFRSLLAQHSLDDIDQFDQYFPEDKFDQPREVAAPIAPTEGLVVDDDDGDDDDDDDDDDDIEADVMSGGIAASGDGRAEEDNY